jgi:hypothetical protein
MTEAVYTTDSTYAFRFGTSDKVVHLNQKQLDLIPYLSTLVAHKDDFLSSKNENGEYVLNHPIEPTWFMAILHSITYEQPYTLFSKLPEDDDLLAALQLFDYLGIKPFPLPLLYKQYLDRSSKSTEITDYEKRVKYYKASLFEARQTAAEFIIALSKEEYYLKDSYTAERIHFLIEIILSNPAIFSSRFRHHTLTIVKKYCYSFFSKAQRCQLQTIYQMAQNQKIKTSLNLSNDGTSLPDNFDNTFSWRGVYVPIEDNKSSLFKFENIFPSTDIESVQLTMIDWNREYLFCILRVIDSLQHLNDDLIEIYSNELKHDRKDDEAKSARSGYFNTVPQRPNVDKFKNRFNLKVQKYR